MGDIVDLGRVYWSEPTYDEIRKNLLEEIQFNFEENEMLKRQVNALKKKLAAQPTNINPSNVPDKKITQLLPNNTNKLKPVTDEPIETKPKTEIVALDNLELDKSFWSVPRQLKELRKILNKLELNLLDHFLDKLHAWQKEYGFFTISELAREYNTSRSRVRFSLKSLEDYGVIIQISKDNLGKIILFNTRCSSFSDNGLN